MNYVLGVEAANGVRTYRGELNGEPCGWVHDLNEALIFASIGAVMQHIQQYGRQFYADSTPRDWKVWPAVRMEWELGPPLA